MALPCAAPADLGLLPSPVQRRVLFDPFVGAWT